MWRWRCGRRRRVAADLLLRTGGGCRVGEGGQRLHCTWLWRMGHTGGRRWGKRAVEPLAGLGPSLAVLHAIHSQGPVRRKRVDRCRHVQWQLWRRDCQREAHEL